MTAAGWLARALSLGQSAPVAVALLIAANLVPLVGVLWFGWDVALVLITYWLENGIVGLLNVPKILLAQGSVDGTSVNGSSGNGVIAAFFLAHYGLFWIVHGVFVFVLTGFSNFAFLDVADPIRAVVGDPGLLLAAAVLFISHAASFWLNYVGRGEFRKASAGGQMWQPYPRMFVLHVTIVLGGVFLIGMRQPVYAIALLVILKTSIDLVLHLREHRRAQRASPTLIA